MLTLLRNNAAPIAKAIAGALVPVVLFAVGWIAQKTGISIDVDADEANRWFQVVVTSLLTGGTVWYTKNGDGSENE